MTNNTVLYASIDLPNIPENLVQEALDFARDNSRALPETGNLYDELSPKVWFREIKDIDGRVVRGRPNIRFDLSEAFNLWVRENICKIHDGAYVNVVYQNNEGNGRTAPIHTDVSRDWVMIYLLEISNTDQVTKFWQEKNQPLIRDRSVFANDWDNCELVGEANFELNKWYVMNTRVLHSIHNINGDRLGRISIQVKVDNPLEDGCFYGPIKVISVA